MTRTRRNAICLAACCVVAVVWCAVYLLTTGAAFVGT